MQALGQLIQQYEPDIIALQEITSEIMEKLRNQKCIREYFVSDPEAKLVDSYGNVLLSKVQFRECVLRSLETRMGRKANLASFVVQKAPMLTVGTFHLESYLEDAAYRQKQLTVFKELTQDCSHVILIGDTNFSQPDEVQSLGDRFKDVWQVLHQQTPEDMIKNPGLTFDTETNAMLKEEYTLRKMGVKRQRLDRCFYTHETIVPLSMEIVGTKPYGGTNEFISDHYGVIVKFKFKPT